MLSNVIINWFVELKDLLLVIITVTQESESRLLKVKLVLKATKNNNRLLMHNEQCLTLSLPAYHCRQWKS